MKEENKKKSSYWDRTAYALLIGIPLLLLGRYIGMKTATHNKQVVTIEDSAPWSVDKIKNLKNAIGKGVDSVMDMDSTEKEKYCDCAIQKLKSYAPKGIDSISTDSARKLLFKASSECTSIVTTSHLKKWTPKYIQTLKRELILNPDLEKYSEIQRDNFCDCYISQIQEAYPNGFIGIMSGSNQKKFAKRCLKYLMK